ncbi:hypothetical protein AB0J86_08300 [Micromonospora sp. NPDC049559]|uniref:hypothetical protein n=1 Tax=Micromonospora sp. NPDC049559 TaxID=3155923 RepID=UPI003447DEF1
MSSSSPDRPGVGDFDFLIGSWQVTNRRLVSPLSGGSDWDEFPGVAVCHGTLFGGAANLDEISFPTKGLSGLTLRLYDPQTRLWSLNWVSSRDGRLTPPIVGRFTADGYGEFHGDDSHEGRPVRCRFIWSRITPVSARWEQAFSVDGGATWETNWIMEFARVGAPAATDRTPASSEPVG